jgi:hypothetical protein
MITGSLAAVVHRIDRITKRKSDIVCSFQKSRQAQRIQGARASFATLHAVYAVRVLSAKCNQLVLQDLPLSNSAACSWLSLVTIRSMYSRLKYFGLS